jgi:hypothetical protein
MSIIILNVKYSYKYIQEMIHTNKYIHVAYKYMYIYCYDDVDTAVSISISVFARK